MKNTSRIPLSLLLLASSMAAFAEPLQSSVSEIPLEKCDWGMVKMTIEMNELNRQVEMGAQSTPLLKEMTELGNKAQDRSRPVGDQLNKEDLLRFQKLSQQNIAITFSKLIESDRKRDINVFDHLLQTADRNYRWNTAIQENNPEFIYQQLVSSLPAIDSDNTATSVTLPPEHTCTVQLAMYKIELEAINKLNDLGQKNDMAKVMATLNNLSARYHMKPIDRNKLPPKDQKAYDDLRSRVLNPLEHEDNFINTIEHIRNLETASELIYETGKQDLLNSGGDGYSVGAILEAREQKGEVDKKIANSIRLMRLIAKMIPSEVMLQAREINKIIDQNNKPEVPKQTK